MATFLLIVHGLLAVVLLGGITHQAMSAAWPSRNKTGVISSFRAVSGSVYTNANIVLYLATAILGGTIYPVYRVGVRTYLEMQDYIRRWARLRSRSNSFPSALGCCRSIGCCGADHRKPVRNLHGSRSP
jgi:hypothetical protein